MKSHVLNLLDFLSQENVMFFIPPYQRNYTWDNEQCRVLWDDVRRIVSDNSEHFFGTITFFREKDSNLETFVLIDGQQRITTVMLFLAALREVLTDDLERDRILNSFLINKKFKERIKLKQIASDAGAFAAVIGNTKFTGFTSSIIDNYAFFKTEIKKIQSARPNFRLVDLLDNGLAKFSCVTIELDSKKSCENPQIIFEAMNSLGKPLSFADLTRNFLLMGLNSVEQEKYYEEYWKPMESRFSANLELISNFFREYMQGKDGRFYKQPSNKTYKELYRDFKYFKNTSGGGDAKKLLENLLAYSEVYAWIVSGNSCGDRRIDRILKDFRLIKTSAINSFLLMLLMDWKTGKFKSDEIIEILKIFITYFLRRRICEQTKNEDKVCAGLSKKIPELQKAIDKSLFIWQEIKKFPIGALISSDKEVYNRLFVSDFYQKKICPYLLALLEERISGKFPSINNLTVDPIMPETLTQKWINDLGNSYQKIHTECLYKIGNLTLISGLILNCTDFSIKKNVYSKEELKIATEMIIDCNIWNEESINRRSKWICNEFVYHILPFPQ